jgi:hypothetical protein
MAGSASTIPASAAAEGRSPNPSPAATDSAADPTALSVLATLNAACRKPRYSVSAPKSPATPATAPQIPACRLSRNGLTHGVISNPTSSDTTCAASVTRNTFSARVASPAA